MENEKNLTFWEFLYCLIGAAGIAMTKGVKETAGFFKEKSVSFIKKALWLLAILTFAAVVPPFILIWVGIELNINWLITLGGLLRTFCWTLLAVAVFSIVFAVDFFRSGFDDAGRRFLAKIKSVYIMGLLVTLAILFLKEPIKANMNMLPIFVVFFFLAQAGIGALFSARVLSVSVLILFIIMVIYLLSPKPMQKLASNVRGKLESPFYPEEVFPPLDQLRSNTFPFFNAANGKAEYYYSVDPEKGIRVFNGPGNNRGTGDELSPWTKEIGQRYLIQCERRELEKARKEMADRQNSPATTRTHNSDSDYKNYASQAPATINTRKEPPPAETTTTIKNTRPKPSSVVTVNKKQPESAVVQNQLAVLAVGTDGEGAVETSKLLNQLRFDNKISVTNEIYLSRSYFEKFIRGQTEDIAKLNLSGKAKYLLLCKKTAVSFMENGELTIATVRIKYCVISTANGSVVKTDEIEASNPAFSEAKANEFATAVALAKIPKNIAGLI